MGIFRERRCAVITASSSDDGEGLINADLQALVVELVQLSEQIDEVGDSSELRAKRTGCLRALLDADAGLYDQTLELLSSSFQISECDLPTSSDAAESNPEAGAPAAPAEPAAPAVAAEAPALVFDDEVAPPALTFDDEVAPAEAAAAAAAPTSQPSVTAVGSSGLRAPNDAATVDLLIEQTIGSNAIVVLYCMASSAFTMSGVFLERVADTYTCSALYDGAPLVVLQLDVEEAPMAEICALRGVTTFPTVQVWRQGTCEEVAAADLERLLLKHGVQTKATRFDSLSGTATFEGDLGTGKPSATAVDEIDFTGGRALGTNKDGTRGLRKSGRTTRDFFPGLGLDEKPGDNMGKDGPPGSQPRNPRRDRPPGF